MHNTTTLANAWLVCPRPNPRASLRLFCFPHAGGGVSAFSTWTPDLLPGVELCLVQLPGRENRIQEPPVKQLSVLVRMVADALGPAMTCPFAFFGHSMGALIAFELARELRRQGRRMPQYLFASAHRAPQLENTSRQLHTLPDGELIQEMAEMNGTPAAILDNQEFMQLVLPIFRADLELCETYVYTDEYPLGCSISAFGGTKDPEVTWEHLISWQQQTCMTFTVRMFPGDHFFIQQARATVQQDIALHLAGRPEAHYAVH